MRSTAVVSFTLIVAIVVIGPAQADDLIPDGTADFSKAVKNFRLNDVVSGKPRDLDALKGQVVVLAWYSPQCGSCPDYNKRIKSYYDAFATLKTKDGKSKVAFMAVCSNSMDRNDDLKDYAANHEFKFPMLRDADGTLAVHFGVQHTCTFAVIDQSGKLQYRGGFDDALDPESVKQQHLKNVTRSLLANKPIVTHETLSYG